MNNEIKEILDYLKEIDDKDIYGYVKDKILAYEEGIKLLDYITNLQEERDFYKCTDSMNVESNIKLRARIDKAIEILGQYTHYSTPTEEQNSENEDKVWKARDILQGENNE